MTGDSVILAFDPTNRSPDAAASSRAYHVSTQKPAGAECIGPAVTAGAGPRGTWLGIPRFTRSPSRGPQGLRL